MFTMPVPLGIVIVHLVELLQSAGTIFEPTVASSAPGIGRKPVPKILTVLPPLTGPTLGPTLVMEAVVFRVAYAAHIRAVRPGKKVLGVPGALYPLANGVPRPLAMS